MTALLVDRYTPPTDLAVQLAGVTAASLYVSYTDGKNAQPSDVRTLESRNRAASFNFEQSSTWALGGATQAAQDAPYFMGRMAVCGVHGNAGIASYDYAYLPSRWHATLTYATEWAARLRARGFWAGGYGDYQTVSRLWAAGVLDVAWQTAAWSDGDRFAQAALYQHVFTNGYDLSDINGNFRGWTKAGPMFNPSKPKPVTPALTTEDDEMLLLGYGQVEGGGHLFNLKDGKGWRLVRSVVTEETLLKDGAIKQKYGTADFNDMIREAHEVK